MKLVWRWQKAKKLEVGMRITEKRGTDYRIVAIINHGMQVLAQPVTGDGTVCIIDVGDIGQVTEQKLGTVDQYLDDVTVVGERYVDDIDHNLADIEIGQPVLLQREGDNQYDSNAISVWNQRHGQLGYVARYQNQVYAELLDQHQWLYGTVKELDRKQQRVTISLWRAGAHHSPVAAIKIRQRVAQPAGGLGPLPNHLLNTPLGDLTITAGNRPLEYQAVPLSPWLTPADELVVTKRYLVTPNWQAVRTNDEVVCHVMNSAQVVQRWQDPDTAGVVLTNANSFFVVGLGVTTMTGENDNLSADATAPNVIYRIGQLADHNHRSFIVSWVPFGDPHAQPAMRAALSFPEQPFAPYKPVQPQQDHATFKRQELAALLVSGLPNYQGDGPLEPSVADLTVEKLRVTLGDSAYHALANYRNHVQLLAGSIADVNETLVQALIHAVIYREIATLNYHLPTVGMVTQPVYPIQLFSTTAKDDDERLIGCLAFYNYDTFELQQVPLSAISSVAVIAQPEHPQISGIPANPDWLQIFLHSWNDDDLD